MDRIESPRGLSRCSQFELCPGLDNFLHGIRVIGKKLGRRILTLC